jgi:acetyltransferase-like isoleucine patch superfamily enzyme
MIRLLKRLTRPLAQIGRRAKKALPVADPTQRGLVQSDYSVGRGTYGSPTVRRWGADGQLRIGSFCSFAERVEILLGGEHRTEWITTYPFNVLWPAASAIKGHPATKGDVEIGHDVWVGTDAMVLSGVKIGSGAVVGARSVVTRDVRPYEIVAGNPATHVRFRFDEADIAALLDIAWWDWDEREIEAALPDLLSPDVQGFVRKYSSSHRPKKGGDES